MIAVAVTAWAAIKKMDWRVVALIIAALVVAITLQQWSSGLIERGRIEVRQQWAEANRRADLKQLALVASQQKQINATEAALADERASRVGQIAGLEAALANERAKNAKPKSAGVVARPACDGIPDGVRNALNAIGRTNR